MKRLLWYQADWFLANKGSSGGEASYYSTTKMLFKKLHEFIKFCWLWIVPRPSKLLDLKI